MEKNFYITTPSFNAIHCINDAILGIVTQAGNFSIRYHVQDGGSTDGTVQCLEEWERLLASKNMLVRCKGVSFSWKSEPDSGMYQAINRGFAALNVPGSGIMAWANTDDHYLPHAFSTVAEIFKDVPELQWMGGAMLAHQNGQLGMTDSMQPYPPALVRSGCCDVSCWRHLHQAPMFWTGDLWRKAGGLNESLQYAGDYELWPRFAQFTDFAHLPIYLCIYASHAQQLSKQINTTGETFYNAEKEKMYPLKKRRAAVQQFWKNRIRPPKGPSLQRKNGKYHIAQATAWPAWGQGMQFYKYRLNYYLGLLRKYLTKFF